MFAIRRRMFGALTPVLCAALLFAGAPAQAGEIKFTDPQGDATGLVVEGLPRPSDPELDILEVSFTSNATSLSAVIKLEALGTPVAGTGASRQAGFTYEGNAYWFRFQAPQPPTDEAIASGFLFRKGGTTIPCGRCSGKLDPKTNSLLFTAEFKSMTAGMKTEDPDITPIGPGSKITVLTAESYRTVAAATALADTAAPAGELEFTL